VAPIVWLAIAAATFAHPANAEKAKAEIIKKQDPPGITATFYKCVEKTYSDAVAAGACLTAAQDYQDKRLNVA